MASISSPGIGSGLDINSIITQLVAVEKVPLTKLQTEATSLQTKLSTYGAAMSRFEFAISNLRISGENQSAARGRIMDADFAAETAELARSQILQQAGTAMVAQANQVPQQVLQLLRG